MASNNEFFVELGLKSNGFNQGLKNAGKDVDKFADAMGDFSSVIQEQKDITLEFQKELVNLERQLVATGNADWNPQGDFIKKKIIGIKDAIGDQRIALKDLNNQQQKYKATNKESITDLFTSYSAMSVLNKVTGGLATQFRTVIGATKAFNAQLKITKSALITTGIGILVVLLGEVIANWKQIIGYFDDAAKKAKEQKEQLNRSLEFSNERLKTLKLQNKQLTLQGGNLDDNLTKQKKELTYQLSLALISQQRVKDKLTELKIEAKKDLILKRAAGRRAKRLGSATTTEITDEQKSGIEDLNNELTIADGNLAKIISQIAVLLKDPKSKTTPTTLKDLTGIDTSLIDSEIADIQLAIVKLRVALKDSSSFAETESTLKQIYDDEIRLIQLQLAKKLKLADGNEVAMKIAYTEYGIAEQAIIQKNNDAVNKLTDAQGNIVGAITKKNSKIVLTELDQLDKDIGSLVENGLGNALVGIGEALGTALSEGTKVIDALGNSLLSSMGSFISKFGELLIAYGIANNALYKAMTNPANPISAGVAIAAGTALVVIGSALSSLAKSGAQTGGGATSSTGGATMSAGGGLGSTGFTSSTSSGGFEGRVVFEIAGSKLIGVLNNTSRNDLRTGVDNGLITAG
tara:strand:+ start:19 stop:1917 length:1899 start_codon:yes stop_codon:yes gene_type:complete